MQGPIPSSLGEASPRCFPWIVVQGPEFVYMHQEVSVGKAAFKSHMSLGMKG
jgi:hypothetical protein